MVLKSTNKEQTVFVYLQVNVVGASAVGRRGTQWAYAGCVCVLPVGGRNLEARPGGMERLPVGFQERKRASKQQRSSEAPEALASQGRVSTQADV